MNKMNSVQLKQRLIKQASGRAEQIKTNIIDTLKRHDISILPVTLNVDHKGVNSINFNFKIGDAYKLSIKQVLTVGTSYCTLTGHNLSKNYYRIKDVKDELEEVEK